MPPPIPVPRVSTMASDAPRAAPARCSARAELLPSLSTNTGSPRRSAITSANAMSASGVCTPTATGERPYKLYRSVPRGLRARLRGEEQIAPPRRGDDGPGGPGRRRGVGPRVPWWRRRWSVRRVLTYLVLAVVAWLVLSLVLFLVSAQIQSGSMPDSVSAALTPGSNMLTGTDTVLVIGTDQRPK